MGIFKCYYLYIQFVFASLGLKIVVKIDFNVCSTALQCSGTQYVTIKLIIEDYISKVAHKSPFKAIVTRLYAKNFTYPYCVFLDISGFLWSGHKTYSNSFQKSIITSSGTL